jgi:hypothetical protein
MVHFNLPASNPARKQEKSKEVLTVRNLSLVGLDSQQKSALQHDTAPFEHPKSSQCPSDNPRLAMHE